MEWPLPIVLIDAAIALIAFLAFRNRREQKTMESQLNRDYHQADEKPVESNYAEARK